LFLHLHLQLLQTNLKKEEEKTAHHPKIIRNKEGGKNAHQWNILHELKQLNLNHISNNKNFFFSFFKVFLFYHFLQKINLSFFSITFQTKPKNKNQKRKKKNTIKEIFNKKKTQQPHNLFFFNNLFFFIHHFSICTYF